MIRPLVLYPDPALAFVSAPVEVFDAALADLVGDMFETMYAAPGRGLAAVQVGVLARVFIMDATWKAAEKTPMVFVNPEIFERSARAVTQEEGCLSIPGMPRRVSRPAEVALRWQGLDARQHEGRFSGFEAACIQHEFDHLEGRLILDHEEAE